MAEQRLIEVNAFRESMKERYRKTEKLIKKGEKHLDHLAEGFTEVDELLSAAPTVPAVVLPCKVGDTVYRVITEPFGCDFDGEMERCGGCRYVDMPCDDVLRYDPFEWGCGFKPHVEAMPFFSCMVDMIGKTVFLTKEAAEAALAERRA